MTIDEMCAVVERATAKIESLKAALTPFAERAVEIEKENPNGDDADTCGDFTLGECRAALAALRSPRSLNRKGPT